MRKNLPVQRLILIRIREYYSAANFRWKDIYNIAIHIGVTLKRALTVASDLRRNGHIRSLSWGVYTLNESSKA